MWGKEDIHPPQGRIRRQGLFGEGIQGSSSNSFFLQCLTKRCFVYKSTSGGVHQVCRPFHQGKCPAVYHPLCGFCQGCTEYNPIRLGKDLVLFLHQFKTTVRCPGTIGVGVITQEAYTEALQELSYSTTNISKAYDAHCGIRYLISCAPFPSPLPE